MRLSPLQWFLGGCAVALMFIVAAILTTPTRATATAPRAATQDPGRRAMAAQIMRTMQRASIPVAADTTGDRDTVLRLTSQGCSMALLDALRAQEAPLTQQGFVSAVCVNEVGVVVATRPVRWPPEPSATDAGTSAPPAEPDPSIPFNAYVGSRIRGGRAVVTGIYANVWGTRCARRELARIGTMEDAPELLEQALRSGVQFVQCAPESGDESIVRRWPSPGVVIPASLEWQRRYVVTPAGGRGEAQPVWCVHDGRGAMPGALCFRRARDCRERERELIELYDRLNPDLGSQARTIYPCHLTETLWCFQTRGSEQQCTVDEEACEEWRDDAGESRSRCEERNAL